MLVMAGVVCADCGYNRDCPRGDFDSLRINSSAASRDSFGLRAMKVRARLRAAASRAAHACTVEPRSVLSSGAWCLQSDHGLPASRRACGRFGGCAHVYAGLQGSYELPAGHVAADGPIIQVLLNLLRRGSHYLSVNDFGAGVGQYGQALLKADGAIRYRGYDGAGNVENWTRGFVEWADLTSELALPPADWVLSLEVGEHIPHKYESRYFANLHAHNLCGVVLSWAKLGQPGSHHVNNHGSEYIRSVMTSLGYSRNEELTEQISLGHSSTDLNRSLIATRWQRRWKPLLPWFRYGTVMVFERIQPLSGGCALRSE